MKKILMILLTFLLFISCSLNESSGLIIISNHTSTDISPVKLDNTYLVSYLKGGSKYDYWFYSNMNGLLRGGSVVKPILYDDGNVLETRDQDETIEFEVGYEYKIDIVDKDGKIWFYVYKGRGYKGGSDDPTK